MPVMKAEAVRRTGQSGIVMDLSDLEREAAGIVGRARAEAAKMVADARAAAERDAARIREEAKQAGQQEGLRVGAAAGRKQGHDEAVAQVAQKLAELVEKWSKALEVFQRNMPVHVADAKTDVVRLALAIAEKVTHQEALRNRKVAAATVEEAFRLIGNARKAVLQVNPGELAMLETYVPELVAKMRTIESVELAADEGVTAGGCVVRFGGGQVDARLETQVGRIAEELMSGEE
jgi:flagellar assembly protein FliH